MDEIPDPFVLRAAADLKGKKTGKRREQVCGTPPTARVGNRTENKSHFLIYAGHQTETKVTFLFKQDIPTAASSSVLQSQLVCWKTKRLPVFN